MPEYRRLSNELKKMRTYKPLMIFTAFFGLEPPCMIPPYMKFVGPVVPEEAVLKRTLEEKHPALFQWLEDKTRRNMQIVVVTFGSIVKYEQWQVRVIAQGLDRLGVAVVWNLADSMLEKEVGKIDRDRYWLNEWIPQQEVLQHRGIKAFLTHAGFGSICEGILAGVPMLCLPYACDQPFDTEALLAQEAAVVLHFIPRWHTTGVDKAARYFRKQRFTADDVYNKMLELLGNEKYKRNVMRLKEIGRAAGGIREACNQIERVALSKGSAHLHVDDSYGRGLVSVSLIGFIYLAVLFLIFYWIMRVFGYVRV